jgi:hypothetical protein
MVQPRTTCYAWRSLLALTSTLFVALLWSVSDAQPSQGNPPPRVSDSAASPAPDFHYFYEPFPMEPGSSVFQIGGSFSLLPYPDAEQELPIPAVDVQYKRGILDNFAVVGSISTLIFSSLVHVGIQWNSHLDKFSFGLACHVGAAYGFIKRADEFDNVRGYGLIDMFILRLGYRFEDFSFSSSFVATYMMRSRSYVNGLEASVGPQHTINDLYCTLAVEQPFLKNQRLSIGFSFGYARTPYQTWMLYNTIDDWLFTPEFFFAVQL